MAEAGRGRLQRSVGFYGLMFVSLGSIIGSGWLLGALNAAEKAGPASIISWLLAAAMLSLLALVYAELGAMLPVAGGGARFPYYTHGPIAGFTAGWASWLQAVFVAPIEVLAAINYIDSVESVQKNFPMLDDGLLNGNGIIVAVALMGLFTAINLLGAKFLSESNIFVVVWKTIVPFLAVGVVAVKEFRVGNFTEGGGFMPFGMHGVFAALTGGVVFALQGFEQAVQLAGEAKNPKRDLSRAILTAMAIGAVLYTLLQVVLIGALDPANINPHTYLDDKGVKQFADTWQQPLGGAASAYGAWYNIALAVGAAWLAKVLLIDAIISPAGTGVIYTGTSARLAYALGEEREMPRALASTNQKGVPVFSIVAGAVIGCIAFGPFKSWNALVNVITSATAIMYAFAPLSLAALHKVAPDRPRSYRMPAPKILLPAAFCSANLIIYWCGFDTVWKLAVAMLVGLVLFGVGAAVKRTDVKHAINNASWLATWLIGHVLLAKLGNYGGDGSIPDWWDIAAVVVFSLGIFYLALHQTLTPEQTEEAIAKDAHQLEFEAK